MGLLGKMAKEIGEVVRSNKAFQNEADNLDEDVVRIVNLAESGDVTAMEQLGERYMEGDGIGYSPKMACEWWTKAAEAGQVDAMFNLGRLYRGDYSNLFLDDQKSAAWFYEVGMNGDMEAREEFERTFRYSRLFKKWVRI